MQRSKILCIMMAIRSQVRIPSFQRIPINHLNQNKKIFGPDRLQWTDGQYLGRDVTWLATVSEERSPTCLVSITISRTDGML